MFKVKNIHNIYPKSTAFLYYKMKHTKRCQVQTCNYASDDHTSECKSNNNRCMYKTKQIQWQLISIKILDMVNI